MSKTIVYIFLLFLYRKFLYLLVLSIKYPE